MSLIKISEETSGSKEKQIGKKLKQEWEKCFEQLRVHFEEIKKISQMKSRIVLRDRGLDSKLIGNESINGNISGRLIGKVGFKIKFEK